VSAFHAYIHVDMARLVPEIPPPGVDGLSLSLFSSSRSYEDDDIETDAPWNEKIRGLVPRTALLFPSEEASSNKACARRTTLVLYFSASAKRSFAR